MMQVLEMFYLLDAEQAHGQDTRCFLLEDNTMLIQRTVPSPARDKSINTEPTEVVIDVVGVSGAEMATPWVLLLG